MQTEERFSIIISCSNEEETIEECIKRTVVVAPNAEIIVIHGGRDRTADIAEEIAKENPNIRVLRHFGDCGKGHAIKTGISLAKYDLQMQLDADIQFAPERIPDLIEPILKQRVEVVFGSRFIPESRKDNYKPNFFRDAGNKLIAWWCSVLTGHKFTDVTAGFKAWTRKAIWEANFKDNAGVYEAEMTVRLGMKGYKVEDVPVIYNDRFHGISMHTNQFKVIKNGLYILLFITLIRFKIIK